MIGLCADEHKIKKKSYTIKTTFIILNIHKCIPYTHPHPTPQKSFPHFLTLPEGSDEVYGGYFILIYRNTRDFQISIYVENKEYRITGDI